ncbi:MAG: DUF4124 domain-containing protein [Nevskia sp.]
MRPTVLIPFLLIAVFPVAADVYRYTDDKGVVHYTDKPPAKDAKPAELPKLQTYKPSVPAAATDSSGATVEAKAPVAALRIVSPQPEETIRDAEGKISIVLATELQPGQGLVYYLDGKAQNREPTPSTGYLVTGAERGEHQLSAAGVGDDGRELARAAPVTVFMMPSVVRKR